MFSHEVGRWMFIGNYQHFAYSLIIFFTKVVLIGFCLCLLPRLDGCLKTGTYLTLCIYTVPNTVSGAYLVLHKCWVAISSLFVLLLWNLSTVYLMGCIHLSSLLGCSFLMSRNLFYSCLYFPEYFVALFWKLPVMGGWLNKQACHLEGEDPVQKTKESLLSPTLLIGKKERRKTRQSFCCSSERGFLRFLGDWS